MTKEFTMKIIFIMLVFIICNVTNAQTVSYKDSMRQYIAAYVARHEVVTGNDKKKMQFFPADENYRVVADFESIKNAPWFNVNTSSGQTRPYRQYGKVTFFVNKSKQILYLYQSQNLLQSAEYWDYLFLPFMDATNGNESYETGRYIDLKTSDIKDGKVTIDFNKAYNPYCAYVSDKYSCPVPPKENRLKVGIRAGEKKFH